MIVLRFGVAVVLALHAQGLPLLLQQIGWVNMMVRYSSESGVLQGVRETFDGSRPCAFCHAAADASEDDKDLPRSNGRDEIAQTTGWRVVRDDDAAVPPRVVVGGYLFVEPGWGVGCGRVRPAVPPPRWLV